MNNVALRSSFLLPPFLPSRPTERNKVGFPSVAQAQIGGRKAAAAAAAVTHSSFSLSHAHHSDFTFSPLPFPIRRTAPWGMPTTTTPATPTTLRPKSIRGRELRDSPFTKGGYESIMACGPTPTRGGVSRSEEDDVTQNPHQPWVQRAATTALCKIAGGGGRTRG